MIVFAAIACFPYIPGSQSEGFRGISIFLGLLISLGSAAAIGNVVAGVVLTYMRPFRVGDRVKIADTTGDVMEKTRKLPRQGDSGKGELPAVIRARKLAGGIPSNVSWGRSSLYSRTHSALISRTCSSDSNT